MQLNWHFITWGETQDSMKIEFLYKAQALV